jgi:hypothetical protein
MMCIEEHLHGWPYAKHIGLWVNKVVVILWPSLLEPSWSSALVRVGSWFTCYTLLFSNAFGCFLKNTKEQTVLLSEIWFHNSKVSLQINNIWHAMISTKLDCLTFRWKVTTMCVQDLIENIFRLALFSRHNIQTMHSGAPDIQIDAIFIPHKYAWNIHISTVQA